MNFALISSIVKELAKEETRADLAELKDEIVEAADEVIDPIVLGLMLLSRILAAGGISVLGSNTRNMKEYNIVERAYMKYRAASHE